MLFKRRLLGIWHFTSVQSIITLVDGYFSLNCSGMCLLISSLDGHMGTSLNFKYKKIDPGNYNPAYCSLEYTVKMSKMFLPKTLPQSTQSNKTFFIGMQQPTSTRFWNRFNGFTHNCCVLICGGWVPIANIFTILTWVTKIVRSIKQLNTGESRIKGHRLAVLEFVWTERFSRTLGNGSSDRSLLFAHLGF